MVVCLLFLMMNAKQLKFNHQYANAIRDGEKMATFRVQDDKGIEPGDFVELVDKIDGDRPMTWVVTGEMQVLSVEKIPLSQLSKEQLIRAEAFDSIDEMVTTFRRFYGEYITKETVVSVISFLIHRTQTRGRIWSRCKHMVIEFCHGLLRSMQTVDLGVIQDHQLQDLWCRIVMERFSMLIANISV